MRRATKLVIQGLAIVALGVIQASSARDAEAAPTSAAFCTVCWPMGCPMVYERVAICSGVCDIVDDLPACNYWGDCGSSLDGEITCSGPVQ